MDRVETTFNETWIELPAGERVYAHVHRPIMKGRYPGVLLVPGGFGSGTDLDTSPGLTPDDISSLGFTVLHYDPSGRGRTGGEEDFWGPRHQRELAGVLKHLARLSNVDEENLGVFSFSIGIVISTGALSRFPVPRVRYLYDWEGPSNRFVTTKNDTMEQLRPFHTSNEGFWREREASRFIGDLECAYFRYQALTDHVQDTFKGHATELLNLATRGKAAWTRCNDNPVNTLFDESRLEDYHWVPETLNNRGQILKYLLEIQTQAQGL